MQSKEITVREFETTINDIDDIEEPIILKRENKKDLVVISLEEYQKAIFLNKLEKSKKQYKEGKVHSARTFFKEMREKYKQVIIYRALYGKRDYIKIEN